MYGLQFTVYNSAYVVPQRPRERRKCVDRVAASSAANVQVAMVVAGGTASSRAKRIPTLQNVPVPVQQQYFGHTSPFTVY